MKYIYETEDPEEAEIIMNAWNLQAALQEFDNLIRTTAKHDQNETNQWYANAWREQLRNILTESSTSCATGSNRSICCARKTVL